MLGFTGREWSNYAFGGSRVFKHGKYLAPAFGEDASDESKHPRWLFSLGLWLMNPAVTFEPIAAEAHSIVLASP